MDLSYVATQFYQDYAALLGVLFGVPMLAALLVMLLYMALLRREYSAGVVFSTAFALILVAFDLGYLTGASRDSAVGDVAPALLGAAGTLVSVTVLKTQLPVTVGAWVAILFTLFMMSGVFLGIQYRIYGGVQYAPVIVPDLDTFSPDGGSE